MKKILSMLLVLAVLFSCIGTAFVTETAAAETATETKSASDELIVADWLFGETVYYRDAETIMKEYSEAGITDVYLLAKGTGGKLAWQSKVSGTSMSYGSRDILEETCTAAKKYGVRVHAWMCVGQDGVYSELNSNAIAYHFRVGTSDSLVRNMDLNSSDYKAYMRSLIKELNEYDLAGIHFDYIRYGNLFYGWGASDRANLINNYGITKAEYNAAVKAMCVTASEEYGSTYYLSTNSDGYYVYSSSGSSASGVNFAEAMVGQGSTDAKNGTLKVAQMRKDLVKNFIAEVTADLSSDKVISCAIMPEAVTDYAASAYYCQDPAVMKDVVDYVSIMSYASQYGGANTWPATLAKECAKDGCNAVAAVQTFDCENSNADPTCTDIYNEFYNVVAAKNEIADDSSYSGKILGCAFFRAAKMTLAGAYIKNDSTMTINVHQQDELQTGITKLVFTMKNGVKISSVSNKSGWGSSNFTISSDKTKLTITSSSEILSGYGSASFDITYTGTVSETTGACFMQSYNSSGEDYGFCTTIFPKHEHSYTSKITQESTCAVAGVKTYTCSCGDSYTENLPLNEHVYTGVVTTDPTCSAVGVHLFKCSGCSSAYTEDIPKIAHSYTENYNDATGLTTYTCSSCGNTFESACGLKHERIETWTAGENQHFAFCYKCNLGVSYSCKFVESARVPATCTQDGSVIYVCGGHIDAHTGEIIHDAFSTLGCTNTYTESIPASCTYTFVSNLDGTHHRVCVACGKEEAATNCTFANGICTTCGYADTDYTLLHFKDGRAETTWKWEFANGNGAVSFDSTTYGAMIGNSTESSGNPYFLVWPQDSCSINHTVAEGDVVEVRLRLDVTSNPGGSTTCIPDVRLQTGTSAYASLTGNAKQTISLTSKDWQTVQIPIVGKVYSEGYVINRILFDPWNALIYLGAQIEVDYIYIGQPETAPSASANNLYFDFTNTERAAARYNGVNYEGNNFDVIPWGYNTSMNDRPIVSYANEGTLSIGGITGTSAYAQTVPSAANLPATPLEYTVASGDIVEMRFKTENLLAASGANASVSLVYDVNNEASFSKQFTFNCSSAEILSGEYVTVRTSATADQLISALRPTLNGICDNGDGKFIIDYIYVGSADEAPSASADILYFDFTNTEDDRARYDTYAYGYYNYDLGGWGYNSAKNSAPTFDSANGYMSTVILGESPYLQINAGGSSLNTRPLNFNPANVEMVQIRLKLSNLQKTSSYAVPAFALKFAVDDATSVTTNSYLTYKLTEEQLNSNEFITITLPVGGFFDDVSKVTTLQLSIADVKPISGKTASVTFDSIYVGPRKDDVNFVYFYNANGTFCLDVGASISGSVPSYRGDVPQMEPVDAYHYEFDGWVDASGKKVDLATLSITDDLTVYVSYASIAHEYEFVGDENGHSGLCSCGVPTAAEKHNWDNGVVTTEATCTTDGVTTYTCETCGYTREEIFTAEGHSYEAIVTEPTCTEQGYTTHICACGDRYVDSYVDALDHNCIVTVTDPTCTEDGYSTHVCSTCGDTYVNTIVPAYGHSYESKTTQPTCTQDGSTVYTCSTCGDTYSETIPALSHSTVYNAKKAATCTTDGYGAHYHCNTCGKNFIDENCTYAVPDSYLFIKATGHKVTFYSDKDATCTENGYYAHYKCANCSTCFVDADCAYSVPEAYITLTATGHTEVTDAAVAPTCTATGLTAGSHCSVCGEVITAQQTVPATGHNFISGVCACGEKENTEPTTVYNKDLGITMNISVGTEMQIMYTIFDSKVKSFERFYLEVEKEVAGGENIATVYSLENSNMEKMYAPNGTLVGYSATYTGIFAMEMGDNFTATLYAVAADGTINYGTSVNGSIKTYLMTKLTDATSSDALKTLAVDMLNYGAAAQKNFGYDVENLVNADLTREQMDLGTKTSPSAVDNSATTGTGSNITASVSLQSKVMLYINCNYAKSADSNLEFVVKNAQGDVLDRFAPNIEAAKIVQGIYSNVGASQMRELITIELYDNGKLVSQTLTWSVESYVAQTRSNSANALTLRLVVNAMLIYGDSAARYFNAAN